MKLNPCSSCGSSFDFVVNSYLTEICCRVCGKRAESNSDAWAAWNDSNPLPKKEQDKEQVRYLVTNCRTCPVLCISGGKPACAFNLRPVMYVETPPTWCPLRETGSVLIELKDIVKA